MLDSHNIYLVQGMKVPWIFNLKRQAEYFNGYEVIIGDGRRIKSYLTVGTHSAKFDFRPYSFTTFNILPQVRI